MAKLAKRILSQYILRLGVLGMTSPYRVKGQCYKSWEYVPTIISDRDSDLIGVKLPQTQDALEEKVQYKLTR